jgi:hypothetical protein
MLLVKELCFWIFYGMCNEYFDVAGFVPFRRQPGPGMSWGVTSQSSHTTLRCLGVARKLTQGESRPYDFIFIAFRLPFIRCLSPHLISKHLAGLRQRLYLRQLFPCLPVQCRAQHRPRSLRRLDPRQEPLQIHIHHYHGQDLQGPWFAAKIMFARKHLAANYTFRPFHPNAIFDGYPSNTSAGSTPCATQKRRLACVLASIHSNSPASRGTRSSSRAANPGRVSVCLAGGSQAVHSPQVI